LQVQLREQRANGFTGSLVAGQDLGVEGLVGIPDSRGPDLHGSTPQRYLARLPGAIPVAAPLALHARITRPPQKLLDLLLQRADQHALGALLGQRIQGRANLLLVRTRLVLISSHWRTPFPSPAREVSVCSLAERVRRFNLHTF